VLCDECKGDGTQRVLCPECGGTKFCSPRPVLKSVSGVCTNTLPNCSDCFGTGVFTVVKEMYTSDCICKIGVVYQSCKKCDGSSLAIRSKRGLVAISKQLLKTIKNQENLLAKIKMLLR
jgi:hypothetical protein